MRVNKEHLRFGFDVLEEFFRSKKVREFPKEMVDFETALFVTWYKDNELAGCIGTF